MKRIAALLLACLFAQSLLVAAEQAVAVTGKSPANELLYLQKKAN